MVNVIYKPIQEVIIMEVIKYNTPEELLRNILLLPGQPAILYWAEEVVFYPVPLMPNTSKIVEELLNGRIYWTFVSFAEMREYSSMVAAEKGPEAVVINVSRSKVLREVASWLKRRIGEE